MSRVNKNILFSTTRQWNPGDEFIMFGILNVMRSINPLFNPIIFNRSPEIHRVTSPLSVNLQFDFSRMKFRRLKPGWYDNSYKKKYEQFNFVDLAVFAGTPEWGSEKLYDMYNCISKQGVPVIYLGVGAGKESLNFNDLSAKCREAFKKAELIIVRDQSAAGFFERFNPYYLPCPALFSAPPQYEKTVTKVTKIGLIFCSDKSAKYNKINAKTYDFMMRLYEEILFNYKTRYDFEFICHYLDELPVFPEHFAEYANQYSYDSREYIDIYHSYDLVIGPRVHGIGLSASMGIPGVHIAHDVRGNTCVGFRAETISHEDTIQQALTTIDSVINSIEKRSVQLRLHKNEAKKKYIDLLTPVLNSVLTRNNNAECEVVDSNLYDENYYLTSNEGFDAFITGLESTEMHYKYKDVIECCDFSKNDVRILDIGCGRGELVYYSAREGADAVGIDYSEAAIKIAHSFRDRLKPDIKSHMTFMQGDANNLAVEHKFNYIFFIEVWEHMYDHQLLPLLRKAHVLLADDGELIITTPNGFYERYLYPAKRIIDIPFNCIKFPMRVIRGKWKPESVGDFLRHVFKVKAFSNVFMDATHVNVSSPVKIKRMLEECGFSVRVRCWDYSKNILSIIFSKWAGREMIIVAKK